MKRILFFTAARAASMFIYELARDLCEIKGIPFTSMNSPEHPVTFEYLINLDNWNDISGCVGPMRSCISVPGIEHDSVILHMRDPRDLLTSWYYSIAYSHPYMDNVTPAVRDRFLKLGIDESLFDCELHNGRVHFEAILRMYQRYCRELLGKPNVTLVKYEELVTDYPRWLSKVLPAFEFDNEREVEQRMVEKYKDAFRVDSEDILQHKRQITPGDYRRKLKPETIEFLNEQFEDVLQLLDYPVSESLAAV